MFFYILFFLSFFNYNFSVDEIVLAKKKSKDNKNQNINTSSYKTYSFKDTLKVGFYIEEESHELIKLLKIMLEKSGYFSIDLFSKEHVLDSAYKSAEKKDCLFLIDIEIKDKNMILKIHNSSNHYFMFGKSYTISKKKDLFLRKISKDIYSTLFGNEDNPFEQFVIFLDKGFNNIDSQVVIFSPFGFYEHTVLKTNYIPISDIGTYDQGSIWCSLIYPKGVAFKSISSDKKIKNLGMFSGTPGSLIKNNSDLFFILSGSIYRHVYEKNKFKAKPFLMSSRILACLCPGKDNSLFYTDGRFIYQCWYDKDFNIIKRDIFKYKNFRSLSPYYNKEKDILVFTANIDGYTQLVLYDFSNKKYSLLTTSPYHKMDPAFSGDYIVYSSCKKNSSYTNLEIMNIETGHIEKYEKEKNMYLCPCWMTSKI